MKSMAWTLLLFSALAFAQDAKEGANQVTARSRALGAAGETSGTPDGGHARAFARAARSVAKNFPGAARQCLGAGAQGFHRRDALRRGPPAPEPESGSGSQFSSGRRIATLTPNFS